MIFRNIDSLLSRIEEENDVMVYIEDDTADEDITAMGTAIEAIENV
jgi:cell division protein FtsX